MTRAEQESTARIRRDELVGLLDTMAPADEQPITARVRLSDIQAEAARDMALTLAEPVQAPRTAKNVKAGKAKAAKVAVPVMVVKVVEDQAVVQEVTGVEITKPVKVAAEPAALQAQTMGEMQRLFNDVNWDDILGAAVSAMVTPSLLKAVEPLPMPALAKRPSKAPFAHLAAMLPVIPAPVRMRAKTNNDASLPRAEQKAVQVIADVRAKLECAEEVAAQWDALRERASFPTLSPQVAAQLSGEEIAMLPMEIRLMLPDVQFPRIAMTPVPTDLAIGIHSTPCKELGHSIRVSEPVVAADPDPAPTAGWSTVRLLGYFLVACLAGLGAVYCLA